MNFTMTCSMKLPTVGSFLGCCALRTGTLVIGIIQAVTYAILFLVSVVFLAGGSLVASGALGEEVNEEEKEVQEESDDEEELEVAVTNAMFFSVLACVAIVSCVFNILVSSLLVHGARTRRSDLLMPWILVTVFNLCFCGITIVGALMVHDSTTAALALLEFLVAFYFLLIVTSFKKEIGSVYYVIM